MKLKIGIQGDRGSTNEKACRFFAEKHRWEKFAIEYLITSEGVLSSLDEGEIDFGTIAWRSSRSGLVAETQEAVQRFQFHKIDEVTLPLDHALLRNGKIDEKETIQIFSHPHGLKEHWPFLKHRFPLLSIHAEIDTAVAAKKLADGEYPRNSLVIAPIDCASLYDLDIFLADIPTNAGYEITIYLIEPHQKKSLWTRKLF